MWIRIVMAATMVLIVGSGDSFAEQEEASDKKLILRAFTVPQSYFSSPDLTSIEGTRQEKPRVKILPADPAELGGHRRLDVRDFFATQGTPISAGGEAIFFEGTSTLVIRATKQDWESLELLGLDHSCNPGGPLVQITLSLVRFSLGKPLEDSDDLSYVNLRRMAGDSWQLIDRQLLTTKSGNLAMHAAGVSNGERPFANVKGEETAESAPESWRPRSFSAGEFGTRVGVEPVIGPDSLSVDVNLEYRHRLRPNEGEEAVEHSLTTSVAVWDGYPAIVDLVKDNDLKNAEGAQRYRALILKVQLVNLGGWNQLDLDPRQNKPSPQ